ncbi:hypothetical protein [Niallia sp. 03133]|uniref:hypothetical protein n=1 Tax=Niallia sp. 03133 TaxID=3458060 RepID=UPI004043D7AE
MPNHINMENIDVLPLEENTANTIEIFSYTLKKSDSVIPDFIYDAFFHKKQGIDNVGQE